MSSKFILPLNDSNANLETVGGKGMSLAKLANAGLPVPGGFHITTEAYRQFVDVNDLQAGINSALERVDVSNCLWRLTAHHHQHLQQGGCE